MRLECVETLGVGQVNLTFLFLTSHHKQMD